MLATLPSAGNRLSSEVSAVRMLHLTQRVQRPVYFGQRDWERRRPDDRRIQTVGIHDAVCQGGSSSTSVKLRPDVAHETLQLKSHQQRRNLANAEIRGGGDIVDMARLAGQQRKHSP